MLDVALDPSRRKELAGLVADLVRLYARGDFTALAVWDISVPRILYYGYVGIPKNIPPPKPAKGPMGICMIDQKPVSGLYAKFPDIIPELANVIGYVTCYPIKVSENIIGALGIGRKTGDEKFSYDDELKLKFIADLLSIIFSYFLYEEKLERLSKIKRLLLDVLARFVKEEDPTKIINFVVQNLKEVFDAYRVAYGEIDRSSGKLKIVYFSEGYIGNDDFDLSPFENMINEGKPVLVKRVDTGKIKDKYCGMPCDVTQVGSFMAVPIIYGEDYKAIITMCRKTGRSSFDEDDLEFLGIIQRLLVGILELTSIREEKRKQDEIIERAQRLESIAILAGGIAHDFNNILNVIMGLTELSRMELDREHINRDKVKGYLSSVIEQCERASHLVKQILDFARKTESEKMLINMMSFVKEHVKLLSRTVRSNISISLNIGKETSFMVFADPVQMHQVLMNVSLNAVEAMPDGGYLMFSLRKVTVSEFSPEAKVLKPGNYIVLEVEDTGCGIERDLLDRVFDPFFTTKPHGTGLGLAQVYGIVKAHEGAVFIDSEVGKGTVVRIFLPEAKGDRVEKFKDERRSIKVGAGEKILVIDDNPQLLETVSMMLKEAGYTPLVAATYSDAMKIFENAKEEIKAVISDIVLPDINGVDLIKHIKKIKPEVKTILMTGYNPYDVTKEDIKQISDGFLQKPFTIYDLAFCMKRVLS